MCLSGLYMHTHTYKHTDGDLIRSGYPIKPISHPQKCILIAICGTAQYTKLGKSHEATEAGEATAGNV